MFSGVNIITTFAYATVRCHSAFCYVNPSNNKGKTTWKYSSVQYSDIRKIIVFFLRYPANKNMERRGNGSWHLKADTFVGKKPVPVLLLRPRSHMEWSENRNQEYQRILLSSGLLRAVTWFETGFKPPHAPWPLDMVPISSTATLISNHLTPRINPEDGIIQFNSGGCVRSRRDIRLTEITYKYSCSLIYVYRRFRGTCYVLRQDRYQKTLVFIATTKITSKFTR